MKNINNINEKYLKKNLKIRKYIAALTIVGGLILTTGCSKNETLDDYLFIKPNEILVGWEEEIINDTSVKKVINLNPIYLPYECISENNRIELKKEIYNKLKEIVEKYIIESESEGWDNVRIKICKIY